MATSPDEAGNLLKNDVGNAAPVHTFEEGMTSDEKKKQAESKATAEKPSLPDGTVTSTKKDEDFTKNPDTNDSTLTSPQQQTDIKTNDYAHKDQVPSNDNDKEKLEVTEKEKKEDVLAPSASSTSLTPGSFISPSDISARVGWNDFSTLPNPGQDIIMEALKKSLSKEQIANIYNGTRTDDLVQEKGFIDQLLNDKYYGQWYHNGAAFFCTVVFTFLLTKLGAGIFACLVVGAFLATYYQTSTRQLRRNMRDDIQREMTIRQLETDNETVNWMNHFISRFWLIYEPVLSAQIIGTADAVLSENCPSFLDSLRLTTFTLGTKAPRFEFVKTYPYTEPNVVCMDWKVSFVPNDTSDLTARDKQSHVDPKIILSIRVGKKMIGTGMPVLLEGIAFIGHLRFKIKMFNEFPHVKSVEFCFLEKPTIDYVLKPVGGETFGFDVNNIPGLQTLVEDQIHANLAPMMYAPNVFTLDVSALLAGVDRNAANGVLALTIHSANSLRLVDLIGNIDPYITIHLGNEQNPLVAKTRIIENNKNPVYNEVLYILLNGLTDPLFLTVKDRNTGRKDGTVGVASFDLKELSDNEDNLEGLTIKVLNSGKSAGEIKCDMRYFPVSTEEKDEDGTIIPPAESTSGVLQFWIYDCKDLNSGRKMDTYAIVTVNGKEKLRTSTYKRSANPRWDKNVEVFLHDKETARISVTIMENQLGGDGTVGTWKSTVAEFEKAIKDGKDWWNLKGTSGKLHLGLKWKPIVMTGFIGGIGHDVYYPPIGVIRIHFYGATKLKNVEALRGGKSDPYVRVLSGMQVRDQTEYILDDLDPNWDTALYIPVHSIREDLVFEVMDYNDIQSDKLLGLTDFTLKQIIKETTNESNEQKMYEALEPIDTWVDLKDAQRKPGKGRLHYKASFHPTLELAKSKDEVIKESQKSKSKRGSTSSLVSGSNTPINTDSGIAKNAASNNDSKVSLANSNSGGEPNKNLIETATDEILNLNRGRPEKDIHNEPITYISETSKVIDLLSYTAGVLSVTIHEAKIPGNTKQLSAEILIDSNDPQYKTVPQGGNVLEFNETGDAFIKELEFSNLVVRIARSQNKDSEIHGFVTIPARKILQGILEKQKKVEPELEPSTSTSTSSTADNKDDSNNTNQKEVTNDKSKSGDPKDKQDSNRDTGEEFKLLNIDGGSVRLSFKYYPVVQYTLPPEESLENQGKLTVTSISASNLKAADRGGTSDPYLVFKFNDEKVFKSEVYKKQLNPKFDPKKETFILPVPRRIGSKLEAIIYDWDQLGSHDELARGAIPFTSDVLESFSAQQFDIPLTNGSELKIRLLWQPELLARERQGTSLLNATARAFTAVPGTALGVGGNIVGGAVGLGGKALGTGVSLTSGAVGAGVGAVGGVVGGAGKGGKAIVGGVGKGIRSIGGFGSKVIHHNRTSSKTSDGMDDGNNSNINNNIPDPYGDDQLHDRSSQRQSTSTIPSNSEHSSSMLSNGSVRLYIVGARGLKDKDDYYVRIRNNRHTLYKTNHIKKTQEPEWNEHFMASIKPDDTALEVQLRSRHTLGDRDIGNIQLPVAQPIEGWMPLSPIGTGEVCLKLEVPEGQNR
ncbi:unnamed protein product [Cunninghamella blakesleeana]